MKQRLLVSFILFLFSFSRSFGQEVIEVMESTLKVAGLGEEVFYYGFAEGDQLVFNFSEINGKELKELEIMEVPSSSKFAEYKVKKVEGKTIKISKTGIYKFRFTNSSLSGRVCKIKIQRIPGSEATKKFDTNVLWRTLRDTTYIPIPERYLVRTDTTIVDITNQVAPVSSTTAMNGNSNRSVVEFELPENTISWSYYLGVGSAGEEEYKKGRQQFVNTAAASLSKLPGYGPLAAIALYGGNFFAQAQGDNVKYFFMNDWNNVLLFKAGQQFYMFKQGDVINEASQMKAPLKGKIFLGLVNDNMMDLIKVNLHVTAITVTPVWETRIINQMHVKTRQEPYLSVLN